MDYKKLSAYDLVREEEIADIGINAVLMKHRKTGARIAVMPCEDENKVFNIIFRTPPEDSCGTPHIIEHSVLCGSDKYPVKDPFVELAKGSFNTFLNAMTFPDKTMYPVASTNEKDFVNLLKVYLDAVFRPNIYREENIFLQEGWGYRLNSRDDELECSGVVYNEMKGVFSSPDDILDNEINKALFPDNIYSFQSGGDPDHIPELTYEKFLNFHRKYYHPSNCYIFLYGNACMEEILNYIDKEYLSGYEYRETDSEILKQEKFESPKYVSAKYPVGAEEDVENASFISYTAALEDCFDVKKLTAIDILDYALFSAQGAPVKKAILDAGIGNSVSTYFCDELLQPYFMICTKNADPSDEEKFRSLLTEELEKCCSEGIDRESLYARINNEEFSFREGDYGIYPKGLMYSMNMMGTWLYDEDRPFDCLRQLDIFEELKKDLDDNTGYFENLVRELFLDNTHCASVVLNPERDLETRHREDLKNRLSDIKSSLSEEELDRLIEKTAALREYQEKEDLPEDKAKLPSLKKSDIRKEALKTSNIEDTIACGDETIKHVRHEVFTNGISYVDLLFPADRIPADKIFYLGLLTTVLKSVCTEKHSYLDLSNEINKNLGGLAFDVSIFNPELSCENYEAYFCVRFKALESKTGNAFDLAGEILLTSDLSDTKRIYEIISETWSELRITLLQSGHLTATNRALSYISPDYAYYDMLGGIDFYKRLDYLYKNYDSEKDRLSDELESVLSLLLSSDGLIISSASGDAGCESIRETLPGFIKSVREIYPVQKHRNAAEKVRPYGSLNEGFITSGQVQYVGLGGNFAKQGLENTGALGVLRHILNYDYLWNRIRVDGNAYGCGCAFMFNGLVRFMSFRDPRLSETLKIIENTVDYIKNFECSEEDMEKYIIGAVSGLDTPMTPNMYSRYCLKCYMDGIGDSINQKYRDQMLSTTVPVIRSLAPYVEAALGFESYCVVGSETKVRESEKIFKEIKPLL